MSFILELSDAEAQELAHSMHNLLQYTTGLPRTTSSSAWTRLYQSLKERGGIENTGKECYAPIFYSATDKLPSSHHTSASIAALYTTQISECQHQGKSEKKSCE
jgi:hypothetical protein